MSIVGERIGGRLEKTGISQAELARAVGLTQATISDLVNGKSRSTTRIVEIAHYLSTTAEYLTGAHDDPTAAAEFIGPDKASDRHLPFHGAPRAKPAGASGVVPVRQIDLKFGMGASYLDGDHPGETVHHFPAVWLRQYTKAPAEQLYFAEGFGDSMQPTLQANDLVLIDTSQQTMRMADAIWAVSFNGLGMIKRLRPTRDGGIKILSDNPHVPDEVAFDDELQLLGRVVAIVRKV